MMNQSSRLLFLFTIMCVFAWNEAITQRRVTMRGRVVFPAGSPIPVESSGKLTVELQDRSLADAPARVIARSIGRAIRFPMAFALKYNPSRIINGFTYSLQATIRNAKNELLYVNDVHIRVTPVGVNRTTFIDVPVILVKRSTTAAPKRQWPELVGMNGEQAVRIIKQETGFTNVLTVREGSMLTMDYRTDRVRVFVDANGNVKSAPTVG